MVLLPKLIIPMHTGRGPDGAYTREDDDGTIVEADLMQCRHCPYTWKYQPGSGRKRGWCRRCDGPLCGKPRCMAACVPYHERLAAEERA